MRSLKTLFLEKKNQTRSYTRASSEHAAFIFANNDELDRRTNVLIFIQGGLNNLRDGVTRANKLTTPIMDEPNPIDAAYPIFVAWNANLVSAWFEQYSTHRGQNDPVLGFILAPLTVAGNVGRMLSRLPLSLFEQGYAGIRTLRSPVYGGGTNLPVFMPRPERVNRQYEALQKKGYSVQLDPGVGTGALRSRGMLMLAAAVPKVLSEGVVDTGGKIGWDFMLRRTKTMFTLSDWSFDRGGMDFFAEELVNYMNAHKEKRLIIVGHSMGSIVANELIRRYGERLPIANIVFMGAACGVDDLEHVVIPYLVRHRETSFYNLCLHPGNDSSELPVTWTGPVSPRGSLLDWIDFYYSSADTDYGWTLGKWDNAILGASRFLEQQSPENQAQLKTQVHIKAFGYGAELEHGPQHHGGFDYWTFWKPAFWAIGPYDPNWHHNYLGN